MPDYYQDHNNVLGSKPRGRAPVGRQANPLLAGLILLVCAGIVGALAKYGPAGGGGHGPGPLAYILTEFADGQSAAGSGFFFGADGRLATSRTVAFPQGADKPPTRYRVFAYGSGNPQEFSATVVDQGSGDEVSGNWAVLQLSGGGTVSTLQVSETPSSVAAATAIRIDGFDTSSAEVKPQEARDSIRGMVPGGGGASQFSYAALPPGMDGAPVIELKTGEVIGINVHGVNPGGAAGTGWAVAVHAIPALQAAAAAGQ